MGLTPEIVSHSYFGLCTCGRLMPVRNIGAAHFATCGHCRTYWQLGENLFSGWRYESEADWNSTREFIEAAREIQPVHPVIAPHGSLEITANPTTVWQRFLCEQVGMNWPRRPAAEPSEVGADTLQGNTPS
jgi:hypothetical protein